jgi:hypothetical protein
VDNITIDDVSGTDLALSGVAIDLGGAAGGGDGAADTVTVNGRAGNDAINISTVNGTVLVTGSPATVAIFNAEGRTTDWLSMAVPAMIPSMRLASPPARSVSRSTAPPATTRSSAARATMF